MKKKWLGICLTAALIASLTTGCKKKEQPLPVPEETESEAAAVETETAEPEPVDDHTGEVRSFYTGKWIKEKNCRKGSILVLSIMIMVRQVPIL